MTIDSREGVKARNIAVKQVAKDRQKVIREVMSNNLGRAWIADLLGRSHIFTTTFSSESLQMAFAEGERNVGLQLLADVVAAGPDQYLEMLREQGEQDGRRAADDATGTDDSDAGDAAPFTATGPGPSG